MQHFARNKQCTNKTTQREIPNKNRMLSSRLRQCHFDQSEDEISSNH